MDFSIILFFVTILAGVMTVFAPCIFTFLPIVLGSSVQGKEKINYKKALITIISLGISVFVFSVLLRATTLLIDIDQRYWEIIAGGIIFTQGIIILFPEVWDKIIVKIGLTGSNEGLRKASRVEGEAGYILTGIALGPVFSSCSPTYGFIIGVLLQSTLSVGLLYLVTYIFGLCLMLFVISILGQKIISKLKWGTNPKGIFKRIAGTLFVIIGLMIGTGFHREVEAFIINELPFFDITRIDREIIIKTTKDQP